MFQNSVEVEVCGLRAQESGRGANHAVHRLCGGLVQHSLPRSPSKTTGKITRVKLLQGWPKRWAPGCVKLGDKIAFCLPTAGRRTQIFHLIFT